MQEIKTNPTVRHTTPLQLLAAFAATVAVLFVLLLGACALPAQPVLEHVYDSAQTIQQEGLYPEYFGFKLFQMDNYTDTIMLFEAAAMGEQNPLTAMMTATAYNVDNFERWPVTLLSIASAPFRCPPVPKRQCSWCRSPMRGTGTAT